MLTDSKNATKVLHFYLELCCVSGALSISSFFIKHLKYFSHPKIIIFFYLMGKKPSGLKIALPHLVYGDLLNYATVFLLLFLRTLKKSRYDSQTFLLLSPFTTFLRPQMPENNSAIHVLSSQRMPVCERPSDANKT